MQIGITNPLREFLRWKPFPPNAEEPLLFCWDAYRVEIDGRKMLIVCNAANLPGWVSNGAHVHGEILFAEDSSWGRIVEGEDGRHAVVVDGRRFDAEQFLGLFSGHVGFDLHWQIHDPGDDLPEP